MTGSTKPRTARTAALLVGAALLGSGQGLAATVLTNNDGVIRNSLCVGFDCPNSPAFGFDTIRLQENNLRIHFDDTSTVTSFPANDWRIVINDSTSGGANFYAVEDATAARRVFEVRAGAPANSMFVSNTGRVGLRTAAPVLDLHLRTGNTPAHRLEQDASSGFTAQTWDIAGNEANFFVRDVTGGSRLPFRIRPGAPTSSIDIAASGNVGFGITNPLAILHAHSGSGAGFNGLRITNADTGTAATDGFSLGLDSGENVLFNNRENTAIALFTNGAERMRLSATGDLGVGTAAPAARLHTTGTVRFAGVANCASGIQSNSAGDLSCITSSRRFKQIEGELAPEIALANVMALRPQVGRYTSTPDEPEHWLVAEEVAAVDGALVGLRHGEPYTVKTQNVVADLVAVIQQQQHRIEALERALGGR